MDRNTGRCSGLAGELVFVCTSSPFSFDHTVVLRGDEALLGAGVCAGLVMAAVAKLHLVRLGARGDRQQLVPQADAKYGLMDKNKKKKKERERAREKKGEMRKTTAIRATLVALCVLGLFLYPFFFFFSSFFFLSFFFSSSFLFFLPGGAAGP